MTLPWVLIWAVLYPDGSVGTGSPQLRFPSEEKCIAAEADLQPKLYVPIGAALKLDCIQWTYKEDDR